MSLDTKWYLKKGPNKTKSIKYLHFRIQHEMTATAAKMTAIIPHQNVDYKCHEKEENKENQFWVKTSMFSVHIWATETNQGSVTYNPKMSSWIGDKINFHCSVTRLGLQNKEIEMGRRRNRRRQKKSAAKKVIKEKLQKKRVKNLKSNLFSVYLNANVCSIISKRKKCRSSASTIAFTFAISRACVNFQPVVWSFYALFCSCSHFFFPFLSLIVASFMFFVAIEGNEIDAHWSNFLTTFYGFGHKRKLQTAHLRTSSG